MKEVYTAVGAVDAGTYNGIGTRFVNLGCEVVAPEGVSVPDRDSGFGWVGKYLSSTALEAARSFPLDLTSSIENGKIVDKRLLAWLLIARDMRPLGEYVAPLGNEGFATTARDVISGAIQTTAEIANMKVLQGAKRSATNWRSLFEGLVKADVLGPSFYPRIYTSFGGFDGEVPLAAPFNALPGLELLMKLREKNYGFTFLNLMSAAEYGVECNGLDRAGATTNTKQTFDAYKLLADKYYPEAYWSTVYETLDPKEIDGYPEALWVAARECCEADPSLQETSAQYGADNEAFVRYMLSHTQAFRDYAQNTTPFAIKVGAPSELRFSKWQKQVIERALPELDDGTVPNMVIRSPEGNQYGQISLYYPRLGNRPPYYPDATDEPTIGDATPVDYQDFLESIPIDDPCLKRYDDLERALEGTRVEPRDYLASFRGEEL